MVMVGVGIRKMTEKEDDPMDDITVDGGNLSGWIEKPFMSETDMYRREIAEMQKTNHALMIRIKEQAEEIQKLKEKIGSKKKHDKPAIFYKDFVKKIK